MEKMRINTYKNIIQLDFVDSLHHVEALEGTEKKVEGSHDGHISLWCLNVKKSLGINQKKSHLEKSIQCNQALWERVRWDIVPGPWGPEDR